MAPNVKQSCGSVVFNTLAFLTIVIAIWVYAVLKAGPYVSPLCPLLKYNCPAFEIEGFIEPEFERVKDLIRQKTIEEGVEKSTCVVAYVKGKKVVDVCSGRTHDNRPYREGLQLVYSSTKFVAQVVVATLVDKGYLSFDDKIVKYWPEFGQGNKENVTVADLLQHAAGVPHFDKILYAADVTDMDSLATFLAKQPHIYGGERKSAYHTITQGFYINELVRRVDPKKRTVGQYVREEFNAKLGTEIYIGFDNKTEKGKEEVAKVWPRVAHYNNYPASSFLFRILPPAIYGYLTTGRLPLLLELILNKESFTAKTFFCVKLNEHATQLPDPNAFEMYEHEMPASNGITNAHSLAKLAAFFAGKGSFNNMTLLSEELFEIANTPQPAELDHTFQFTISRTKGGYGIFDRMGGARGWGGLGGSLVLYDPKRDIAFSYVMNAAEVGLLGQRGGVYLREIQAVIDKLGAK